MEQKLPDQHTGKWIFHLQQEQSLQFHIAPEQETNNPILIEGHDISVLLDYLYAHRELIYEATHDLEMRRLEAGEAHAGSLSRQPGEQRIEPARYFDDGIRRVRANL